jgi:hypothetical protein
MRFLGWFAGLLGKDWRRAESDEVAPREQRAEWEQLEGVRDDGGIPESAEHPLP